MAVVWLVVKVLLWILAGLAGLLVLALLVPVTAHLQWKQSGEFTVKIQVLLLRFKVWPRPPKTEKQLAKKQKAAKQAAAKDEKAKAEKKPATKSPAAGIKFSLDKLNGLLATAGGLMRRILAGLRVHAIQLYLPIQGEDAASTALWVGRTHAGLGAAFGVLNNFLNLEFKELTIYPDYTGQEQGKAFFSCKITGQLLIMVIAGIWALMRLKKEKII